VFDLYGDHLSERGHWAPISAVVALLDSCGISPAATRTAVSRMVAQGWLSPTVREDTRGYLARTATRDRLAAAHDRIYRAQPVPWDGTWHMVVLQRPTDRAQRDRVAANLVFLGYGRLSAHTWLAAHRNGELSAALEGVGVSWEEFDCRAASEPVDLVRRLWDLTDLAVRYREFARDTIRLRSQVQAGMPPERAYPIRADLVHRWRNFLFADPGLPDAVLPADWPGGLAREHFLEVADLLRPAARMFVTQTLAAAGVGPTGDPR